MILRTSGGKARNSDDPLPGVLPGRDGRRLATAELGVGEGQQLGLRGLGGGRGVDRAQRRSDTAWTGVSAASDGVREPRD